MQEDIRVLRQKVVEGSAAASKVTSNHSLANLSKSGSNAVTLGLSKVVGVGGSSFNYLKSHS